MKIPNPELIFYIFGVLVTKGEAEEINSLILKTRSWHKSLHYIFHLATGKTAWTELELNYLSVFPALVIDLAFEKRDSLHSKRKLQNRTLQ